MCDCNLFKQVVGQALTTLAFGLICLAISALVLAQAPARRELPAPEPGSQIVRFDG